MTIHSKNITCKNASVNTFTVDNQFNTRALCLKIAQNVTLSKVHKVTELMMMARRAMSKLNFPRFVSLYPKRILVWGSVSLRVASDKAREIQFGHSPSCHHHQFCHFMNFKLKCKCSRLLTLCIEVFLCMQKFLHNIPFGQHRVAW